MVSNGYHQMPVITLAYMNCVAATGIAKIRLDTPLNK
jgi:poly(A) polymerase Pap1